MKKVILMVIILMTTTNLQSQVLKDLYKDFLKYGTIYGAGDISNSVEAIEPTYILERTDNKEIKTLLND